MRYLKYITGIVAGVALMGCSSFLEENPDQRTKIDSPDKIKELLVFAYPKANNFYALEMMTDNVDDSKRTQNTKLDNTAYYSWKDETQESWDSPAEYWADAYKAISQANQALESVEKIQMSKELYEGIKGEALLARAYSHWMLAMTFAEAYDPSTAASKMGIPYVTEVEEDLIKEYKRGTLADVYEKLEADIVEGVRLAKNDLFPAKYQSFHMTKRAGKALAARFFAFKGDWDKVLEYTDEFGDFPGEIRNLREFASLDTNQIGVNYGQAATKTNLLIVGSRTILDRHYWAIRFGVTNKVSNELRAARYSPYGMGYYLKFYGVSSNDVFAIPKFYEYFVYSNQSAGIGQPYSNITLLTIDEAYLHRIEAVAYKGDYDRAAKMIAHFAKFKVNSDVNPETVTLNTILRAVEGEADYKPFYELNDTQRKLFKYIAESRRKEFVHMGNRWYDIKRFNLEVVHNFAIEGTTEVLSPNDLRKAVQLPQSALGAGLTPNPR